MTDTLKEKIQKIKELAQKATPGPWVTWDSYGEEDLPIGCTKKSIMARQEDDHSIHDWHIAEATYAGTLDDAKYIAAVDPNTILEMIAELETQKCTCGGECCNKEGT